MQDTSPALERIHGQGVEIGLLGVIVERARVHGLQHVEPAHTLQSLTQIRQHELDQPLGLPALLVRFALRPYGEHQHEAHD
ncbi:hypothetical protein MBENS4_2330 [Novosphingobium sp. MBES04]|nr:hypothetical protein MBENS4_2330 [Novosphingobium sp. MBES04]